MFLSFFGDFWFSKFTLHIDKLRACQAYTEKIWNSRTYFDKAKRAKIRLVKVITWRQMAVLFPDEKWHVFHGNKIIFISEKDNRLSSGIDGAIYSWWSLFGYRKPVALDLSWGNSLSVLLRLLLNLGRLRQHTRGKFYWTDPVPFLVLWQFSFCQPSSNRLSSFFNASWFL